MTVGTKSLLFGAHQVVLHPVMLAVAWTRLYGFPLDPRIWCAFFLHDIGYLGKQNMDGESGEFHPERGARLMRRIFGPQWGDFTLYHSRRYADKAQRPISRLCVADKLATAITPMNLYLVLACLSGEIHEYVENSPFKSQGALTGDLRLWFTELRAYSLDWVEANKRVPADPKSSDNKRKMMSTAA